MEQDRDSSEYLGGASLYFGFEQQQNALNSNTLAYLAYTDQNAQYGVRTTQIQNDLSTNAALINSYNFPGGAAGSLQTDSFDLTGYSGSDRPTLYFNYWLDTQAHPGSNVTTDVNNPFRDAARVYISADNGATWNLVVTNNEQLSGGNPSVTTQQAELPGFLSHLSDAGLNSANPRSRDQQIRQEMFDTGEWRQARVDLSDYANKANLKLRFDFSTAGAFDSFSAQANGLPSAINTGFGETTHTQRSVRSYDNAYEGFYIDDIIVGFSERGEMVTNATVNTVLSDLNTGRTQNPPGAGAYFDNLSGEYQLELRRAGEFAALSDQGPIAISTTYDTNDEHITQPNLGLTQCDDFETTLTLCATRLPALTLLFPYSIAPGVSSWVSNSVTNPYTGARSAQAKPIADGEFSVTQLPLTALTAGSISFTYAVESEQDADGLRFLIDGTPQKMASRGPEASLPVDQTLASGVIPYQTVTFFFGPGDHTFTWVYSKDDAGAFGRDTAWVDNIVVLQGASGLPGDQNILRPQGQVIINSNTITSSSNFGINVEAAPRTESNSLPHPGALINFPQLNADKFVPGVVIQNNIVVATSAAGGIRFAGDASTTNNAAVPYGRIINNTIYGSGVGTSAIVVTNNAAPAILNNVISSFATGINVSGGSTATVIDSTAYHATGANIPISPGATPLTSPTSPFRNAAGGNFYPADGAVIVDSSLALLPDRFNFGNFKNPLGIPLSNVQAPDRDVYGQLRVDSIENPIGGGSEIFKDRGAVDKADSEQPYAKLLTPIDNDPANLDGDPTDTVVHYRDLFLEEFSILLGDGPGPNSPFQGTGVDASTVDVVSEVSNPLDPDATVSQRAVRITRNGELLVEDLDYRLGYNANNDVLLLTPLSSLWESNSVYVISLDNTQIKDNAGNPLRENQLNSTTQFTIILGDFGFDYGDAPDVSYRTITTSNGARHVLVPDNPNTTTIHESIHLGSRVDGDADGQPNVAAAGDDRDQSINITGTPGLTTTPLAPYTVALVAPSAVMDPSSIVLSDGTNTQTYVLSTTDPGPGVTWINLTGLATAGDLGDALVVAIQQDLDTGNLAGFTPRRLGTDRLSLGGVPQLSVTTSGSSGLTSLNPMAGAAVQYQLSLTPRFELEIGLNGAGFANVTDGQTFTYQDGLHSPQTFTFELASRLTAPINYWATTLDVANRNAFPAVGGFNIRIEDEELTVTAITLGGGNTATFTVTRGVNLTNAAAHPLNALTHTSDLPLNAVLFQDDSTPAEVGAVMVTAIQRVLPETSVSFTAPNIVVIDSTATNATLVASASSLTQRGPAAVGTNFVRGGSQFTIDDGVHLATTFEFVAPTTSTLSADIDANVTALVVADRSAFPSTFPFSILIDSEQLTVTNVAPVVMSSAGTFTVTRVPAMAAAHLANATVSNVALPGNVAIPISVTSSIDTIAAAMIAAIQPQIDNVKLSGIAPTYLGNGLVQIGARADHSVAVTGGTPGLVLTDQLPVRVQTVGAALAIQVPRTQTILTPANGTAGLRDGDKFTINDGYNFPVTFEFEKIPSFVVTFGNRTISITDNPNQATVNEPHSCCDRHRNRQRCPPAFGTSRPRSRPAVKFKSTGRTPVWWLRPSWAAGSASRRW